MRRIPLPRGTQTEIPDPNPERSTPRLRGCRGRRMPNKESTGPARTSNVSSPGLANENGKIAGWQEQSKLLPTMLLQHLVEVLSLRLIFKFCVIGTAAYLLYNKYGTGLNHIPGPFLAGFTDLWRLWIVWGRRPELVHISLHKKYGKLVRLGPRTVLVSDNGAAKTIYALNAGFIKVSRARHFEQRALTSPRTVRFLPSAADSCQRKATSISLQHYG
ncbi:Cytochrome P450 [Macrophomina phaseolina MS6]|uniref:Cytochrome P450 n=1 Tax=Macrophomina phaseolina (strain MS6) TaxID=1126212 RepID=K2S0P8_MACPH|nr:Cytochrome P450 [Macrophomina phaseolina MS6]